MATITATIKRIEYHTININSDDYLNDNERNIQGVIELHQAIQDDPMSYAEEFNGVTGNNLEVEIQSIKVTEGV